MSSILNEQTLAKIKPFRSILLKATVWIFVGGVALGALLILVGVDLAGEAIWKVCGTLMILAIMMIVSVNNFKMLETRNGSVQIFAILALVANLLWALLWIMTMWGVFDMWRPGGSYYYGRYYSFLGKLTMIVTSLSMIGLFVSNILNIQEYQNKAIKPLKVTAVSCIIYEELYAILSIMCDFYVLTMDAGSFIARLNALATFTGFIWIVSAIIAAVMSNAARNRQLAQQQAQQNPQAQPQPAGQMPQQPAQAAPQPSPAPDQPTPAAQSDAELRAEIEQKVRAEMIEKEVRERLAREQAQKQN